MDCRTDIYIEDWVGDFAVKVESARITASRSWGQRSHWYSSELCKNRGVVHRPSHLGGELQIREKGFDVFSFGEVVDEVY